MKKSSTGYKLHLQRLKTTGQSAIRTVKYPLATDLAVSQKLIQSIQNDYNHLYGPLNLQTYCDKPQIHSLKDFWLDCLRCGAIICPTESKIFNTLRSLSNQVEEIDEKQKRLMRSANLEFYQAIDFNIFKDEVILPAEFRKTKTSLGFFLDKESLIAKEFSKKILGSVVGKSRIDQIDYWLENYGVDKSLYQPPDTTLPIFLLPDLSFDQKGDKDPIQLITDLEQYLADKLDGYSDKQLLDYVGPGSNANGLSATFNKFIKQLLDSRHQIEDTFNAMAPNIWQDRAELKRRLQYLADSAKRLGEPSLVKSWADYRSDFGGKLQSWISNGLRQDAIIKEHLFGSEKTADQKPKPGHLDVLHQIRENIETQKTPFDTPDYQESIAEIGDVVDQAIQQLNNLRLSSLDERIDIYQLEDYRDRLSAIKSDLNRLHSQVYGDSEKDRADKVYKGLFGKELPRVPSFFGDVKIAADGTYDKYLGSLNRVKQGIAILQDVDRQIHDKATPIPEVERPKPDKLEESILRFLQGLLRLSQINNGKTSPAVDQIISKTLKLIEVDVSSCLEPKYYIFKPPQARRRGEQVSYSLQKDIVRLGTRLLDETKIHWERYKSVQNLQGWLGMIEITKMRMGLASQIYDLSGCYEALDSQETQSHFPKVKVVFNRFPEEKLKANSSINTVLQQAVCSEMRGTVSKMTTAKIINRWVVQPIDAEKKNNFPIVTDIEAGSPSRRKGQSYYINYPDSNTESDTLLTKNIFNQKVIDNEVLKPKDNIGQSNLIPIRSSKYQIQFLDNALFSKKWSKFKVKLASYSFIYEETSKISWDDQSGCSVTPIDDSGRLFVSIPFEIEASGYNYKLKEKKWSKFLGVDIGEYGVATYILDAKALDAQPSTGFIYDPALRIIKESIRDNKDRQKAGTFSIPNTYTKRLRDQAITSIRNQLHSIVVNSNARPIYEWQVSGFESGSGKVAKIYHSIKRADTGVGSEADDMERNHIWGTKFGLVGKDVDAYATSYNCSKCYESIYAYVHSKDDGDKVYNIDEVISSTTTNTDQGKCVTVTRIDVGSATKPLAYIEDNRNYAVGDKLNGKKVVEGVRKFARPPVKVLLERLGNTSSNLKAVQKQLSKEPNFENQAGTQAVFMCPFCHHVSDADIQAAMWIALKGYLDDEQHSDGSGLIDKWRSIKSGSSKEKIKVMLDFAKEKEIPFVDLDIRKRLGGRHKR